MVITPFSILWLRKLVFGISLLCLAFVTVHAQSLNTLSSQEKKEGWKLLFNGKNIEGWHTYGGKEVGTAWRVDQGALNLHVPNRVGNKAPNGGDLVTDATFYWRF